MAANAITGYFKHLVENVQAYFRISNSYVKRKKPAQALYFATIEHFKGMFSTNKRLQAAKYRVNHLNYRLYQMEKLINENNPNNLHKGKSFNQLR